MKLTKKLQTEVLKVYKAYWDAYFSGDMKTFASFLHDDIIIIGTAISEVFNSKKETLKFYKATADQLVGKAQFRNRHITVQSLNENILVNEHCDLYILMEEEWTFYGNIRASAILTHTRAGWKLVHQHGSFPDTRAEEGEQVAAEKIKEENIQLRDAVKRRTIELEERNRELEIETSLEKVRTIAMGMKEAADMLKICKTISKQLNKLGVKDIRNVQTAIFYEGKGSYMNYEYYAKHDKTFITETLYTNHKIARDFAKKMLRGKGQFYSTHIKGQKVKDWIKYQKTTNVFIDKYLDTASSLNYYWHSLGPVALGISTYSPLSKGELDLFQRFQKVFELAYRRYLDIEKAEVQAKEAQIEAALERVRSKTNAMHRSEDLHKVIRELHDQLRLLEFRFDGVDFMTDYTNKGFNIWLAAQQHSFSAPIHVPAFDHKIFRLLKKIKKEEKDFFTFTLDHEEKNRYIKHLIKNTIVKNIPEEMKQHILAAKGWATSCVVLKDIILSITNLELIPYTDTENAIVKRFAQVFQQSYTRFLDLQKAEAQTREAEIELALERVRAKTMAMQHHNDLLNVTDLFAEQLIHLGIDLDIVNFSNGLSYGDWDLWITGPAGETKRSTDRGVIPWFDHAFFQKGKIGIDNYKKGIDLNVAIFNKKEKDGFLDHIFSNSFFKNLPGEAKPYFYNKPGFTWSAIYLKETWVAICKYDTKPFTDEQNAILRRFANAFGQAYTRFLDLQKAEAQAREAQIEASLERIRSRSLAMHQSKELREVIAVTFEKLNELGVLKGTVGIQLFDHQTQNSFLWVGNAIQDPQLVNIPYDKKMMLEETYVKDGWQAMIKGIDIVNKQYSFKQKEKFFNHIFSSNDLTQVPEAARQVLRNIKNHIVCLFPQKNSALFVDSFKGEFFSNDDVTIIKRAAKVFEQAYIRFLDLQKAEAQAREAQIEAGLERVRSRGMAMQTSEELGELIGTLLTELTKLDLVLTRCVVWIIHPETHDAVWWMANSEDPSHPMNYSIPYHEEPPWLAFMNEWKKRTLKWVYDLKGQTKKDWDEHLFSKTGLVKMPNFIRDAMKAPDRVLLSASFNNFGGMNVASLEPLSDEHFNILLRFAKVFDLTYTRFNDLKQAESQARESQIQLALERVRARSMAMQKSSELSDTAYVVFQQFKELGAKADQFSIGIINEEEEVGEMYATIQGDKLLQQRKISIHEPIAFKKVYTAWKEKKKNLVLEISGKELETYNIYRNKIIGRKVFSEEIKPGDRWIIQCTFFSRGVLSFASSEPASEEILPLLDRFTKVFDGTYTRFLDLQKAEAQSRESQIQLALERVRARTLAMQKSDELPETSHLLFEQMKELGETAVQNSIAVIKEEERFVELSTTVHGHTEPKTLKVPIDDPHVMAKAVAAWKEKNKSLIVQIRGQELKEYNELRNRFLETKVDFPEDNWIVNIIFYSKGWLSFSSNQNISKESFQLLERFAGVFDLTYTRFLDLKQAEAQARESQIQLALERVRARTMAMQRSDELQETAYILFQQFKELGEDPIQITIGIFNEDERKIESSITGIDGSGSKIDQSYKMDIDEPILLSRLYKAWKEQKASVVFEFSGKELSDWIAYRNKIGGFSQPGTTNNSGDRRFVSAGFFSKGFISFSKTESIPVETIRILERFAGVFDLTYTRFLDLKQAEAQAREAKIEAALERVRSRTMAMHQTSELQEVIHSVHKELLNLNLSIDGGSFVVINEDVGPELLCWGSGGTADTSEEIHVPHFNMPFCTDLVNGIKKGAGFFTEEFSQKEKEEYFTQLFKHKPWSDLSDDQKKETLSSSGGYTRSVAVSKYTSIFIINHHGKKFTETENDILRRFAKVFEQTYTRFLDLRKAEAQAREAQIELALERVRARTMAMHKSEELAETAQVMFHQLNELGGAPDRISIGVADEAAGVVNFWTTDQAGSHINNSFKARLNERTVISKTYDAWKEHKRSLVLDLYGDDLKEWIQFAREEMGIVVKDENIHDRRVHNLAFFSHGWILVTTHEPQSTETIQILERFASVFNLTYRRFLDLQKAEAQAHEARVETSLERIRARALAMHKSDELKEVAKVLWEQMALLGQAELEASVVHLYEEDPDNIHSWRAVSIGTDLSSNLTYGHMVIPKRSCEFVQEWLANFYSDLQEYTIELRGEKQKEWYAIMAQLAPEVFSSMLWKQSIEEKRYYRFAKFSGGALLMVSKQEPSAEVGYLQKRAAVVFDLAYRRFLDLQKAEAQAREAQIESALEKVRSRSLAMHKSDELQEVVNTVFERLQELNIETDSTNIAIFKDGIREYDYWIASHFQKRAASFHMPYIDLSLTRDIVAARESGTDFSCTSYSFELKNEWFDYAFKHTDFKFLSEQRKQFIYEAPAITVAIAFSKHTGVQINRYSSKLLTEGEAEILKRFSKVFEQAYIRFLDLEKAEAQAREAQIEASLERVRSKTMAMHNSSDLLAVSHTLNDQLVQLGFDGDESVGFMTEIDESGYNIWLAYPGESFLRKIYVPRIENKTTRLWREAKERGDDFYTFVLTKEEKDIFFQNFIENTELKSYTDKEKQAIYNTPGIATTNVLLDKITLTISNFRAIPYTDEQNAIIKRFAFVFQQSYTRFLDLQKAEAQAREAQIEAGLERVRARTMAMHSSEDVGVATATMFTELEKLGIQNLRGGITVIKPNYIQEVWAVTNLPDGKTIRSIGEFDMRLHPLWMELYNAKENNDGYQYYWLADKDKENYINILNTTPNYLAQPIKEYPDVHVQSYFFGEGAIWTNSLQPHSEGDKQIMKRFASVFSLTFRRYQDLQKAEAQAREATIEAALERVRGKAMAMHSSKDLASTIGIFYHELEGLNLTPRRCGLGLINKEKWTAEISTMNATADGQSVELVSVIDMKGHPVLAGVYNNWLTKTEYHPVLHGNEIKEYYQYVRPQTDFPDYASDQIQHGYFFFFEEGGVYAWTEKELGEDELKIYRRFTSVLSLTYKRYKDLKDAETRAQNAIREAALDRIRADIASMRTVEDLDRITPLIWNELTTLNIPFIRCGVFIMDDSQQFIHTFLSTPDGKAIAAFHLPYDTPGNIGLVISNWRNKKQYVDHWDEEEFTQFADILTKQGALTSRDQYLKTIPKGGFYLHFLPFLQGMLYVGNTTQLNNEETELIQHVADAFSTAYARYEDFNRLEAAKQQVENTLTDLKQAQTQLVQSEKMASLGELTAGIAHEIQNPLNFVNNFSDVSNELLEEMKQELATGNTQQAIDIANDVIDNLDKILHHGKRADAIVKGMLQHSRTSSGQKEMTDINILADEYLRLAYHGLRAKDKSFNAKFETQFDSSIEKINVIPQDIGRVILNLINNAFYTVTEKKKKNENGYEPTVTITTQRDNGKIEIKVRDNGNGIPQKNLDKIFQPFFTTKPTGQGTGLGLSLAYDIVTKGHGGELKVETKEGEGSEFVIQLPG